MGEVASFPVDSEDAVKTLFILLSSRLGYRILSVGVKGFDYVLVDGNGNVFNAEAEYYASEFVKHKHSVEECGLLICWVDDWPDCPIRKLVLSELVTCFEGLSSEELEKFNEALKLQLKVVEKIHRLIRDVEARLLNFNQNLVLQNPPEQTIQNLDALPLKETFTWRDKSLRRDVLRLEVDIPKGELTITGTFYPETCQDKGRVEKLLKLKPSKLTLKNVKDGSEEPVEDAGKAFEELSKKGVVLETSWKTKLKNLADVKPSDAVKALVERLKLAFSAVT